MDVNQIITFTLTAAEFNVVLGTLSEAPYRVAAPIIEKLHRQVLAADPNAFSPNPTLNGAGLVEPTPMQTTGGNDA